jgi:transposase
MREHDIYPQRSQVAKKTILEAERNKLLIVPVDFAKKDHVVQICLGNGEFIYKKPFVVHNTEAGAAWLIERLRKNIAFRHIPVGNVLLAGEDPPPYTLNFINRFCREGFKFLRVNAGETKNFRTNSRTTSDNLALNGIAQAVLCQRAYDIARQDAVYSILRLASRNRHFMVKKETATKNRIHIAVSILFPGFLEEGKTGLVPFGSACLDLLSNNFSAPGIKNMRQSTLANRLKRHHVKDPAEKAGKIKALAGNCLPPDPISVEYHSRELAEQVAALQTTQKNIASNENQIARCLVQSPGFLLTSIPGIGVVLAGGIVGEYGDPASWPHPDRMASYAGIVPRQYQTGGPENPAKTGTLPHNANHHMRNWLIQSGFHVGTTKKAGTKKAGTGKK